MNSTKTFYQEELKRYKTTSTKKAYITRTIKELNETLSEARKCDRFYLGESKYKAIVACENEIAILTELSKTL